MVVTLSALQAGRSLIVSRKSYSVKTFGQNIDGTAEIRRVVPTNTKQESRNCNHSIATPRNHSSNAYSKTTGIQNEKESATKKVRGANADYEFLLIIFAVSCQSGSDMISICDQN